MSSEIVFFVGFAVFIIFMLVLDLGIFSKKSHIVKFREAAIWSAVWVSLAIGFYFILKTHADWIHGIDSFDELQQIQTKYEVDIEIDPNDYEQSLQNYNDKTALDYISMYLIEYMLSADNIFVMISIFAAFGVKEMYFKKVLQWGILGALIMRFLFIWLGGALVERFHWVMFIFGGILIYSGIKSLFEKEDDEAIEPQNHPVVKFAHKNFAVHDRFEGDKFFVRKNHKFMLTPLFLVVMIIEFTDLIFAVDSIPAAFSVSKDKMVIYFANIFAIMGLRSMFFFLSNVMHLFHYLKYGLGILLTYIGLKMIFAKWLHEVGFKSIYSIYIILGILVISIVASLVFPVKKEAETA